MVCGMPFFVQLYGTFQDPYYCYFLMEYAVGGELFTQLHIQRKFSENRARFYACEVLCALEALHSHHVMFRDLKPENLLLDERGHVKASRAYAPPARKRPAPAPQACTRRSLRVLPYTLLNA